MRDIVLLILLAYPAIVGLKHPWIGVLGWTWVSIMNPHQLSWNLSGLPVAAAMAGSTLLGVMFTSDKRNFFVTRETTVLMLFMAWMCITLPFSFYFDLSYPMWNRVMKIDFMVLVAMVVLHSRQHIMALTWVLVGSLAFYGVKGGIFTLATGGSFRVWGPEGSYIEGNNELALALVMTIPLIRFLQMQTTNKWMSRALLVSMVLCAAAALGSQSRGALLAIAAMVLIMWWRGKSKLGAGILFIVVGAALVIFMPDSWTDRMGTIKTYEQDGSAMGRINAWWMAFNLAKENFFGGGYQIYMPAIFARYAPDPLDIHAAHSIYFMVLGEQGFIGLFLFLLLWILVWRSAGKLRLEGAKQPESKWASDLGAMCQVSLAGYAVGGTFLSLSYYDLPYNILVLVVISTRWVAQRAWVQEEAEAKAKALKKAAKGGKAGDKTGLDEAMTPMMPIRPLLNWFSPSGSRARLSVLIFHRVLAEPDPLFPEEMYAARFDQICGWLKRWFEVLPLDLAVHRLRYESLPARACCITFDDGYADNLDIAMPILQRHGLPASFFVATGFLGGGRMWNDTVIEAVRHCRAPVLDLGAEDLGSHELGSTAQRRAAINAIIGKAKYLSHEERLPLTERIAVAAGVEPSTSLMMSADGVRALRQGGMQIGAHTVSHPILARLPAEQARGEIRESQAFLQDLLKERVGLFAYPNGKPGQDYLPEHVVMARELGFDAAVSTAWGAAGARTDSFQIPRFTPWDTSRTRFGLRLARNLATPASIA